jgi:hypothetical protein
MNGLLIHVIAQKDVERRLNFHEINLKNTLSLCLICGEKSSGSYGYERKYCSKSCKHNGMFGEKPPLEERTRKAQRNFRERNANGLSKQAIRNLRLQWISEGMFCAYCQNACETVDHIVPLNRGAIIKDKI